MNNLPPLMSIQRPALHCHTNKLSAKEIFS